MPKGATAGPGFEPGISGMEVRGLIRDSITTAPQLQSISQVYHIGQAPHSIPCLVPWRGHKEVGRLVAYSQAVCVAR